MDKVHARKNIIFRNLVPLKVSIFKPMNIDIIQKDIPRKNPPSGSLSKEKNKKLKARAITHKKFLSISIGKFFLILDKAKTTKVSIMQNTNM
ncbi:hypothetical protein V3C40_09495 [Janthinobacterium sp. LS2A]|uniref:hypothetical protein n=1 Tax=unclassified Janthinobacterium TaxID=2610881 RepID=UPI0029F5B4FA|nr:hypothetical protein [Janthinobacterium sp. GMG2]MDX8120281.1 hypothetical protein [Janthinobacterium sp. GMG2]